jgi:Holliday junction resolvasome RuvABC ATP-dependent DNA helicase subunit
MGMKHQTREMSFRRMRNDEYVGQQWITTQFSLAVISEYLPRPVDTHHVVLFGECGICRALV